MLNSADFSNAVTITPGSPTCTGVVGVIYWQAPEVRTCVFRPLSYSSHRFSAILHLSPYSGVYNPTKADIWSLGATVWEMAESTPPFHEAASAGDLRDRWPPLTRAKEFSRSLHDFLTLCSNPVASRPDVSVLAQVSTFFFEGGGTIGRLVSGLILQMPFVRSAARRSTIIQILKKCRTIESLLMGGRPSVDSQGTLSRR